MVENKFNLGPYEVILDYDGSVDMDNGIAVIQSNSHPDIDMFMFISKVPHYKDRFEFIRDTINNDYRRFIAKTRTEEISPCDSQKEMIGCHPGFFVFFTGQEGELAAYRAGYWLEEDDAISMFASFPSESNFQNEMIDILANRIKVKKS